MNEKDNKRHSKYVDEIHWSLSGWSVLNTNDRMNAAQYGDSVR
jgi:hypothetical protein